MKSEGEILEVMSMMTGTENYHKFSDIPSYPVATDGVITLAEMADCYWLLEIIGSYQSNRNLDSAFQVWKMEVDRENNSAVVYGCNDMEVIVKQDIPLTDFPLSEIKIFLIDGIILLPSEY